MTRVRLLSIHRHDSKVFAMAAEDCDATRVLPFAIDSEAVTLTCEDRGADVTAWFEAALDATWIEEESQALAIPGPELFGQFEERQLHDEPTGVNQLDVLVGAALSHGCRELEIDA